jgi:sodium transport system ATP-binding protein
MGPSSDYLLRGIVRMIEVRNLQKNFGSVRAVTDVSFTAPDGTITGILGRNGAGKTTTLAMICGLVTPDRGSVAVGPSVTGSERRRHIGALLDHKGLYDRLTARENIAYFGELHGLIGARLNGCVQEVVDQLGLERVADRPAAGFSQGERMKVALGRAIVHSPPNLLLDEPTNGLDIPTVHSFRDALRGMRDRGMCIIFSSHVLEEIEALCDNVVIISAGRIAAKGSLAELRRLSGSGSLEQAFLQLARAEPAS